MALTKDIIEARREGAHSVPVDIKHVPHSERTLGVGKYGSYYYLFHTPTRMKIGGGKRFNTQANALGYGRRVLSKVKPIELACYDGTQDTLALGTSIARRIKALH